MVKKPTFVSYLTLILMAAVTGCSTASKITELKSDRSCQVWRDGALEIKHAKVEVDTASTDLHCSFPCISGPPKVMAKFDKSQPNIIISDSNALISVSAKLASITNATLTLESPLEMIKFEPVIIGKDQATVKKKSAGFNSTTEFSFNSNCTTRQAALGITVLTFSNEN